MENLISDSSFEIYHNSEGYRMLNPRILTTYPNEKNSFDVFMGVDGVYTFPFKTESEGNTFRAWVISKDSVYAKSISLSATGKLNNYVQKAWDKYGAEYLKLFPLATTNSTSEAINSKYDPEKVAGAITSGATAISSLATMTQAFKGDGTKPPSQRKQLKQVCGRKPLFKKKRVEYDKCVANYNANKSNIAPQPQPTNDKPLAPPPPPDNKKRNIIIGVVVVALIVGAYVGYKKGLFIKK